jgi:hypothetical protein
MKLINNGKRIIAMDFIFLLFYFFFCIYNYFDRKLKNIKISDFIYWNYFFIKFFYFLIKYYFGKKDVTNKKKFNAKKRFF